MSERARAERESTYKGMCISEEPTRNTWVGEKVRNFRESCGLFGKLVWTKVRKESCAGVKKKSGLGQVGGGVNAGCT